MVVIWRQTQNELEFSEENITVFQLLESITMGYLYCLTPYRTLLASVLVLASVSRCTGQAAPPVHVWS